MSISIALQLMSIGLLAFLCQWLAWRIKLPAILPLLLTGLFLGPATNLLNPQELFGDLLMPGVSLAVAVILFEGALTLKIDEIRGLQTSVRRLTTWGALITWIVMATAAVFLVQLEIQMAILFGALVVVTGPTVIIPLLRSVRPVSSVSKILRWEGIVIDPIGALLVVGAYELIVAAGEEQALQHSAFLFIQTVGLGLAVGALFAYVLALLLKKHLVPEYLRSFLVLAFVITEFVIANELMEESGLVAVTITGIVLANIKGISTDDILHFKENLSIMLISGLFIILAARITPDQIAQLTGSALLLLVVVQFVARPLSVFFSTLGSELNWREKALLSWIAPRGIVAAAISALFAEKLMQQNVAGGEMLVPLTFMIIIGTVALQSLTSRPLAKLLKVAEPSPRGFLIVGANKVSRTIATALKENDFPVLLTDSNWENISDARMAGLPTFYGNPVSLHADEKLDLVGLGRLLGLSQRHELNTIASMRYRMEFGEPNVYTLPEKNEEKEEKEKHSISRNHRGKTLFGKNMSYGRLASLLAQGAEIKLTKLSEEYDFAAYLNTKGRKCWPLFAIDTKEHIQVFTEEQQPKPEEGWQVMGLILEDA